MGQMITITYVGAFISPELDNFQEVKASDEFYEEFLENELFRTAYQGLEDISVLIPNSSEFAIRDTSEDDSDFVIDDFSELKNLEKLLKNDYSDTIAKLKELYPGGKFEVRSGVINYYDEIA